MVDKCFTGKPIFGVYIVTIIATLNFVALALISHWGSVYVSLLLLLAGALNCGPDALLTGHLTNINPIFHSLQHCQISYLHSRFSIYWVLKLDLKFSVIQDIKFFKLLLFAYTTH